MRKKQRIISLKTPEGCAIKLKFPSTRITERLIRSPLLGIMSAVERAGLEYLDRNVLLRFNNLQTTFIFYVLTLTRLYMVKIILASQGFPGICKVIL